MTKSRLSLVLFLFLCNPISISAQRKVYLEPGSVEFGGFGGFTAGLGRTGAGYGGNFAVVAHERVLPYVEVGYFPGLTSAGQVFKVQGNNVDLTSTSKVGFLDFNGGVHLLAPNFFKSTNVTPYGIVGVGALRNSAASNVTITGVVDGAPFSRTGLNVDSATNFAANFGGGLRIYTKSNFGLRLEFKGYVPTGSGNRVDPFFKVTLGVFGYKKN